MQTYQQIVEWHICVIGTAEKGHPIQKIEMQFGAAAATFDGLCEQYPQNEIKMFSVTKEEIKKRKGQPKPLAKPSCPYGHEMELRDGRPAVVRTDKGQVQCSICGYLGA